MKSFLQYPGLIRNNGLRSGFNTLVVFILGLTFAHAALYGKNDYVRVSDLDVDPLDAQLANIIKRVGYLRNERGGHGTGLLVGPGCDSVLTARHNFYYYSNASLRSTSYTFTRSSHLGGETSAGINEGNIGRLVKLPPRVEKQGPRWPLKLEGFVVQLKESAKDELLTECPPIQALPLAHVNENDTHSDCRIIGFPNAVGFYRAPDGKIRPHKSLFSAIPGSADRALPWDARGMAACQVFGMNSDGIVVHNCDSYPGSSGSPIVCLHDDEWKIAGTHDGDTCFRFYTTPECYALENGKELLTGTWENISRAGQYQYVAPIISDMYRVGSD